MPKKATKKAIKAKDLRRMKLRVSMQKEDRTLCFVDVTFEIMALIALYEGGVWLQCINGVTFTVSKE